MPIIDSVMIVPRTIGCATGSSTCGKNGSENRMKPYVPIFNRTPARITDPAVGASTCASGSHVWNGNIGTLMANPMKNATNIQIAILNGTCGAVVYKSGMLKV